METYLRDLLAALVSCGVRCTALVHTRQDQPAQQEDRDLHVYRAKVWFNLAFAPIAPAMPVLLRRIIKHHRPDLLHLHVPNVAAFWPLLVPGARKLPWIVHWHADVPTDTDRWYLKLLYRLYRPFENGLLRRATLVITTSPPYAPASEALTPWRDKCVVVPLGIRADAKLPSTTPSPIEREASDNSLRVLAVGRLSYYKGFDVLIRAVAETPGVILDLIGDGEEAKPLRELIDALGIPDRVRLLGRVPDAEREAYLRTCDCLCLPSIERTEAFGVVLLEAMAAGKPCVATAVPGTGMAWVVQDGVTGLVVPPADADALGSALCFLKNNPNIRMSMGNAGQLRFRQKFRIEQSAEGLLAAYRSVLAGRPPGRTELEAHD